MNKIKKLIIIFVLLCFFSLSYANKGERYEYNTYPDDIKDNFCGIHINYQYCKCAFHNDFCDAINMDKKEANSYVREEYVLWIKKNKEIFAQNCLDKGGIWNLPNNVCIYCEENYVKTKGRCVLDKEYKSIEDKYNLPKDMSWLDKPKKIELKAKVARANGEMFVYSATFRKWMGPVNAGHPIYSGDYLLTTQRGDGDITIYSKTGADTILIGKSTSFEVVGQEETGGGKSLIGVLYEGAMEIYHAVTGKEEKNKRPFQVRTPTIVTSIRGTDFVMTYDKDKDISKVYLIEGEVDVSAIGNDNDINSLKAGDGIVYEGGKFEKTAMLESELQSMVLKPNNLIRSNEEVKLDSESLSQVPIDLDSVVPESLAYTGNLAGDLSDIEDGTSGGGSTFWWILLLIIFVVGVFYWKKNQNKSEKKHKK